MAKDPSALSRNEIESFDQNINEAAARLRDVGKTDNEALNFFEAIERGVVLPGWSLLQRYHALKLGCLCGLRQSLGNTSPAIIVTLGQWLAEAEREVGLRSLSRRGGTQDKRALGMVQAVKHLKERGISSFKVALEDLLREPYTTGDGRYTVSVVFEKGCDWVVQLDNVSKSETRISSGSFRTGYFAKIL